MIAGFRRLYGSGPLHLLGHLVAFFIAAWAIVQILGGGTIINWIAWFVGAALLHDLVLLPLYSLLDRIWSRPALAGRSAAGRRPPLAGGGAAARRPPLPIINHLRVPAAISGILLIVYFPVILGLSGRNYFNDTGHHLEGYTRNWLLITAALFLVSALVYAARLQRRRARMPPHPKPASARERPGG